MIEFDKKRPREQKLWVEAGVDNVEIGGNVTVRRLKLRHLWAHQLILGLSP